MKTTAAAIDHALDLVAQCRAEVADARRVLADERARHERAMRELEAIEAVIEQSRRGYIQ